jgi:hypothetical protein
MSPHDGSAPKTERRELDQYFTPQPLADALVARIAADGWWHGGRVLEPSAGKGAFVRACASLLATESITTVDVDPERCAELSHIPETSCFEYDFLDFETDDNTEWSEYELIIGNPPYGSAEQHVRHALEHRARFGVVAFLLRMGFLESEERAAFWKEHPASKVYVLSQRPSFTGEGKTDRGQSYGLFVWATWHRGPTELEVISWREPKKRERKVEDCRQSMDGLLTIPEGQNLKEELVRRKLVPPDAWSARACPCGMRVKRSSKADGQSRSGRSNVTSAGCSGDSAKSCWPGAASASGFTTRRSSPCMCGGGSRLRNSRDSRRRGEEDGAPQPLYLAYKNLKPYIVQHLDDVHAAPLMHRSLKGNVVHGIRADIMKP